MNSQETELLEIIRELRKHAAPVGPLHSFWDVIFDMEASLSGERAIINKSVPAWVRYGRELLAELEAGNSKTKT